MLQDAGALCLFGGGGVLLFTVTMLLVRLAQSADGVRQMPSIRIGTEPRHEPASGGREGTGRPATALAKLLTLLVVLGLPGRIDAQDWRSYFTVVNGEKFTTNWRAFYEQADALTKATRRAVTHHLDLAYGADPKQRLDLYLPAAGGRPAPVFLFIHGGGFREGDRAQYGFVARPLAARGIITAVASYRLLPHVHPDQVEDVELMVAWLHREIGRYGGDPARIVVGGHSAGAILSALVGVTTDWQARRALPIDVIKAIAPVSGPYDLRQATGFVADFLPDPARREAASPALRIARTPPAIVAFGSLEKPYVEGSRAFVSALGAGGGRATLVELTGMTHDRTALAMGDPDSAVVQALVALIGERGSGGGGF